MSEPLSDRSSSEPEAEAPPVFGSWPRLYIAVLLHLAAWIGLLYFFTIRFRPGS